jgi:hypothetical protein
MVEMAVRERPLALLAHQSHTLVVVAAVRMGLLMALVALAAVAQVALLPPLEQQILAVVAVAQEAAQALLHQLELAEALALWLFVTLIRTLLHHLQQALQRLLLLADTVFTHGLLRVQSHSEERNESFCKS